MESQVGAPPSQLLNMDQAYVAQPPGMDSKVSNRPATSSSSTPLSSTPATPSLHTPHSRRPSHPATSSLNQHSPNPGKTIRRASSAMSLSDQRPGSSPSLVRQGSRTSLGAQAEDNEKRPTPKRSISNLISGLRDAQSKMELIEEPVPVTASQIANEHFVRELNACAQPDCNVETIVIFHDACYGHRYSRLKTSKATLSMIVERPERIHASILGASTAYVRLGGHHAGARHAPHPNETEAIPPPFKIRRTGRSMDITSPYVTNVHGTAWMSELRNMCNVAGEKIAAGAKELSRSSTPTEPEKRKLHEGDLYLSSESLNAFQGALGGVADAVDVVFDPASQTKRAFVAIRPPGHHCSADHPSGFCWLNNVHVGIEYAAQAYGLTHAAILDFDLHHGDGSQAITWERNGKNNVKRLNAKPNSKLELGPDIGYYSLHDINSYPCEMGDDDKVQAASLCVDNAHGQSIWNVHLQPWKSEEEFWQLYEAHYRVLVEKARIFLRHHTRRLRTEGKILPKSAVFISAGFDASEWEGAGMQRHKVNVPTEFYARFTREVVQLAQEEDLGCDGRVISVLEGGYSDRALCSGVLSHLSGLCATPMEAGKPENPGTVELDHMMRGLGISGMPPNKPLQYDKVWWSEANLTALELKVNPPPPAQPKKMRLGPQKTYATPTESFAYKVVDTDKFARSISGTMRDAARPARPPTPPPPEVEWVVATQELSKLLIPTNRQTRSCTPEELAPFRTKKDRMSAMPILTNEDSTKPRQLRDRKAEVRTYPGSAHSEELESLRSVSRNSRRQTIADLPSSDPGEPQHQQRASRRLSAVGALSSKAGDLDSVSPSVPKVPAISRTIGVKPPATSTSVQVKKTRMTAPPKPKKTALSSAPVSPSRTTKPPASGVSNAAATGSANNDLEKLTSGMKTISLKVGPKEEHDQMMKENVDAKRRARALKAAETRKANAAAKKATKEAAVPGPKAGIAGIMPAVKENAAPPPTLSSEFAVQPELFQDLSIHGPEYVPPEEPILPEYYPTITAAQQMQPIASPSHAMPGLNPQEQQQPQRSAVPQDLSFHDEKLQQQSPLYTTIDPRALTVPDSAARQLIEDNNVANGTDCSSFEPPSSPIRPMSAHQLPVWHTTGPIPFASSNNVQSNKRIDTNSAKDTSQSTMNPASMDGTLENMSVTDQQPEEETSSIWDIPETPQR